MKRLQHRESSLEQTLRWPSRIHTSKNHNLSLIELMDTWVCLLLFLFLSFFTILHQKHKRLNRKRKKKGVLVDDLITRGVSEPYRLFTSRSEFRLYLRPDNADQRLTQKGIDVGLVGSDRANAFQRKKKEISDALDLLKTLHTTPNEFNKLKIGSLRLDGSRRSAFEILRHQDITISKLCVLWPELSLINPLLHHVLEADCFYDPYLVYQHREIDQFRRNEQLVLPQDIDYDQLNGLLLFFLFLLCSYCYLLSF